jgi:hypothetical protein
MDETVEQRVGHREPTRGWCSSFIAAQKWFSSWFHAPVVRWLVNATTAGLS